MSKNILIDNMILSPITIDNSGIEIVNSKKILCVRINDFIKLDLLQIK